MMQKILSIVVLSLLLSGSAHSFMTYGEFKELIVSDETSAKWYLRGIINGNLSHSRYMNIEKPEN